MAQFLFAKTGSPAHPYFEFCTEPAEWAPPGSGAQNNYKHGILSGFGSNKWGEILARVVYSEVATKEK